MALRSLRRSPWFAAGVVVLLGLGIGSSTLIFTAIDGLLLRPLPVARPERLVRLGVEASANHVTFDHSSIYAQVLAGRGRSFAAVFTYFPVDAAFAAGRYLETVTCEVVSDNYFTALGLTPRLGGLFDSGAREWLPAVVSEALWRRAFGGRADAAGAGIRVRGAAFTVVGVLGKRFGGLDLERRADLWVPQAAWRAFTGNPDIRRAPARIFMRLRDGVAPAQVEAEVRTVYPAMVEADLTGFPGANPSTVEREKQRRVVLAGAAQGVSAMRRQFSSALGALLAATALLLLLVAANAGGLMLARGEARRREVAVRLSLGAPPWAVARTAFAEAAILTGAGTLLGWPVARWCGPLLIAFLPARRPLNLDLSPDPRVLAFTIVAAAGVALAAGMAPALRVLRTAPALVLGKGGDRVSAPAFGRALVATQVALAALLGAGSVSLVRSLDALREQDPGFARERLIVAVLDPRTAGVRDRDVPGVYREILRRAGELPGAAGVSLSGYPLMRGVGMKNTMGPAGARLTPSDRLNVSLNFASETHFANMGMKLMAGRNLVPADAQARQAPVVVTESLARLFFPGADPLEREFGTPGPDGVARPGYRVIGVVRDVKYRGMREMAPPTFFAAFDGDVELATLYVRSRIGEARMMRQVRDMLAKIGPGLAPVEMAGMEQEIETSLWQERMLAALSRVFAVLAVLIATIGLLGLLAFTLARRTREVGIRVALGATRGSIAGLFARQALSAFLPGLAVGLAGFALVRRGLDPLLFGKGTAAGLPEAVTALLLALAALAALVVPVVRATRIEPLTALREE